LDLFLLIIRVAFKLRLFMLNLNSAISSCLDHRTQLDIDPAGDLTLRVYYGGISELNTFIGTEGTRTIGKITGIFKVNRQVLRDNSAFFRSDFSVDWSASGQEVFDLGEEHVVALGIWLRVVHKTLVDGNYTVDLIHVWHVIELGRKYLFEGEKLNEWFEKWMEKKGGDGALGFQLDELRQLVYPCYQLQNAQGFADVTRRLAYETEGHVSEYTPRGYHHLHVHPRVISKLHHDYPN
jgi:hypothetical protein